MCCAFNSASNHRCLDDRLDHPFPIACDRLWDVDHFTCVKCSIALRDPGMALETETLEDSYFHLAPVKMG